ncbi:MAG: glycosyltransferase family 39 protein [Pyrinomonadaceae bacterium]
MKKSKTETKSVAEPRPEERVADAAPSDRIWLVSCLVIAAIAIFLRFYDLALKPFHHDEGVNGFFLTTLFRDGIYKYDPANYHGPTLYYIALAFAKAFGLESVPIRASVAVFGVLIVIMAMFLQRYIGRVGSLFAALLLALSPGMVFISRYFIHEIFFVFLSFAMVLSMVYFIERQKAGMIAIGSAALLLLVCFLPSTLNFAGYLSGPNSTALWAFRAGFFIGELVLTIIVIRMLMAWNDGRPVYFILAAACISLMFATKETAFITLGTFAIACVCVWMWRRIYGERGAAGEFDAIDDARLTWLNFFAALGTGADRILILVAAAAAVIYLFVLFFSSFFTYPEGVKSAFEAYAIWTKTGSKDHTQNGRWAYLEWGFESEAPIFVLSAIGTLIALAKARHRFAMFSGFWAFGLLAAYTIIPYKTPWLALSFLLPMCLASGYAINELWVSKNSSLRIVAGLLAIGSAAIMSYQAYDLNFVRYDDESTTYVYAHTKREFLDLMKQIDHYAEISGKGKDAKIDIVSPDYWPMVWYTKDYKEAIYHGHMIDPDNAEMVVAKKDEQDAEIIRMYSAKYVYTGIYALRPGVDLVLLVRKDLAENGMELYRLNNAPK